MDERSYRRLADPVGGWSPAALARLSTVAVAGADTNERKPGYYALVGSHAYGFATADSDVDVRGVHLADGRRYALLDGPRTRVQVPAVEDRETGLAPVEFESLELRTFADAIAGGDFALVEAVLAAPVVRDDMPTAVDSLRELLRDHLPLGLPRRYVGMARSLRADLEGGGGGEDDADRAGSVAGAAPKTALYALRAVYAAAYVDEHADVVADVRDLARAVDGDLELVRKLIEARRAGGRTDSGDVAEVSLHDRTVATLDRRLDVAEYAEPTAADRAAFRAALDEWQCETRGWSGL